MYRLFSSIAAEKPTIPAPTITKSIPSNSVAAGNPAKVIRELN